MIFLHPAGAHHAAGLFVGVEHENDIARERQPCALEQQHENELDRVDVFHVERAAPVNVAVRQFAPERVVRPLLALDRHDVHMAHQ